MRIRAKKGAILLCAIAGAAVVSALIVYNVNHGNSVNVSDIEDSGLLSGLAENVEEALNGNSSSAVIADADSGETAASAGVIGGIFDEEAQKNEESSVASTSDSAVEEAASGNNTGESAQQDVQGGEIPPEQNITDVDSDLAGAGQYDRSVSSDGQPSYDQASEEVRTYVEVIPQTRSETIVDERVVRVEVPVSVVEEITVNVEADPVYFYSETGTAAAGELTTTRRAQEALAAKKADMERLEAAAKEAGKNTSEGDWNVPASDSNSDSFIVFD